jgi:hypothetical protein
MAAKAHRRIILGTALPVVRGAAEKAFIFMSNLFDKQHEEDPGLALRRDFRTGGKVLRL